MRSATRRRLLLAAMLAAAAAGLGVIAFGNMGESLVYFWDPSQLVAAGDKAVGATVRLGGLVKEGSLDWRPEANILRFELTDGKETVAVRATSAPPQMFREGIGCVVEGTLTPAGVFEADRLMVKHSNEYRAPEPGKAPGDLYTTVEGL